MSLPVTVETATWGDIVSPFGTVNFLDISALVDKFKGLPSAPSKLRSLLRGNIPPVGEAVNFLDISLCVDAFKGLPYAHSGPTSCSGACP